VCFRDAFYESVQTQASQVIGHLAQGDLVFLQPEHLRKQWPQLPVAESLDLQGQEYQDCEERLNARVAEAQRAGALAFIIGHGFLQRVESLRADAVVVADGFDFQHPPVGREADLAQQRQVLYQAPYVEVITVVDGGFGPQGRTFLPGLVILFEVRVFVIDVQRRDDSLGDDARPASAVGGGCLAHPAREDQLHLFRTAQIDVVADDLLEELPAMHGTVPNLGQGELGLQN